MICPKCGNKIKKEQLECRYCGTRVQNIVSASNVEAKKIIKGRGDLSKIVYSTTLPSDIKKSKLLLYAIFLGWLGMHCFYVGRQKRGFVIPLLFLFCTAFVAIPETWFLHAYLSGTFAGLLGVIAIFCWWLDICRIIGNKFQVPVVLNNY